MLNKERVRQICEGMIKGVDGCVQTFDFDGFYDNKISPNENLGILKKEIAVLYPRTLSVDVGYVDSLKKDYDVQKEKEDYEKNSLKDYLEVKEIIPKLFNEPKIIGISGDKNSGKSNLIYNLITELKKGYKFKLFTYGLRFDLKEKKIHSVEELETIKNSVVIIDEMASIFDFQDRKKRKLIERTLRLIFHNNNILILVGNCENYKKFISSKCDIFIYFKSTISEFINGSRIKDVCLSYRGYELGSSVLDLEKDECIIYDWAYKKIKIPYLKKFDSKRKNVQILCKKRGI